jgi:choline dehydrogenase
VDPGRGPTLLAGWKTTRTGGWARSRFAAALDERSRSSAPFSGLPPPGFPGSPTNHPEGNGKIVPAEPAGPRVYHGGRLLLPARDRPNLTIGQICLVNRVPVRRRSGGQRDIGVADERYQVRGRRVTLAAGAIGSPAILLRSGIGAAALAELGIEPVADLPASARA